MARIIGIDLGAHSVKLGLFEGGFGRFQLTGYEVAPLPPHPDGDPPLEDRLVALDSLLAHQTLVTGTVGAASWPAEQASVRLVELPFGDRSQVEKVLPFEVENLVPFDMGEMVLTHRILSVDPTASRVLVALAHRSAVAPLLAELASRKVDPKVLVVDADLLGDLSDSGVQAVVDMGHSRTLVSLCRDGHVISARALDLGGHHLTQALASALDLPYIDAEQMKHATGLAAEPTLAAWSDDVDLTDPEVAAAADEWSDETTNATDVPSPLAMQHAEADTAPDGADPQGLLLEAMKPLLQRLRTTLISFEDAHGAEIDEVILTGGGAALAGVTRVMTSDLGVPVRRAHISEEAELLNAPGRFALCHAAAIKAGGSKGRALDLRVDDLAFKGDLAALGNILKFGAMAALAFFVAGVGLFAWNYSELSSQLADVEGEIAAEVIKTFPDVSPDRVREPSMAMAIMQEKTLATAGRVEALGAITSDTPPTLSLLKDVSESMPVPTDARIDVREMVINATSITMKAETDGFEDATKIEAALQRMPRFKDARKGDEKKSKSGVKFNITIPLGEAESDEG